MNENEYKCPESIKLWKENSRQYLWDWSWKCFFRSDYESTGKKKTIIDKIKLHSTEETGHRKIYNEQNQEATHGLEENICKSYMWWG